MHPLSNFDPTSPRSRVVSPVPPRSTAYQAMSARDAASPLPQHSHHGMDGYGAQPDYRVVRATSPGGGGEEDNDYMDEAETEIVNELLTRTPRTSYTVAPSVLAAEVSRSQHHDEELCVLLHAADDQYMHDVVKRAVRKAIRGRLKKLGMKSDNDVSRQRMRQCEAKRGDRLSARSAMCTIGSITRQTEPRSLFKRLRLVMT